MPPIMTDEEMKAIHPQTLVDKFTDFADYCAEHGKTLRNHREFGDRIRDLRYEIGQVEEGYKRVLAAANGRGMPSEMKGPYEVVALVHGLHDRIDRLEKEIEKYKKAPS